MITYYFSHDANARRDPKILALVSRHGWAAYGIFWALIESMFESKDTSISEDHLSVIAYELHLPEEELRKIISACLEVGLFHQNAKKITSRSLRGRKKIFNSIREARSRAGQKGMKSRWNKELSSEENGNKEITQLYQQSGSDISPGSKVKSKQKENKNKTNVVVASTATALFNFDSFTLPDDTELLRTHINALFMEFCEKTPNRSEVTRIYDLIIENPEKQPLRFKPQNAYKIVRKCFEEYPLLAEAKKNTKYLASMIEGRKQDRWEKEYYEAKKQREREERRRLPEDPFLAPILNSILQPNATSAIPSHCYKGEV